eukprot:scaffold33049_cov19-Tisochrysis_lutea.AAC.1
MYGALHLHEYEYVWDLIGPIKLERFLFLPLAHAHALSLGLQCQPPLVGKMYLKCGKVGPKNNPQETYNYSYLPFCKPQGGCWHFILPMWFFLSSSESEFPLVQ